jgi:hypothetical protein
MGWGDRLLQTFGETKAFADCTVNDRGEHGTDYPGQLSSSSSCWSLLSSRARRCALELGPEGDMRTILLTDAGVRILLAAMTFIALLIGLLAPDELPSSGLLDWFPAPVLE